MADTGIAFWERYESLCRRHGEKPFALPIKLGLLKSNSAVSQWKSGSVPRAETIEAIAAYFKVSIGYLLGVEEFCAAPTGRKVLPLDRRSEQLLICAERYAIGRRTYIVADVTKYVSSIVPDLSDWCLRILMADILDAKTCGLAQLGDDCDQKQWIALEKRIDDEMARREMRNDAV